MEGVDGSADGEEEMVSSPFHLSGMQPTFCRRTRQAACEKSVGGETSARETDPSIILANTRLVSEVGWVFSLVLLQFLYEACRKGNANQPKCNLAEEYKMQ